MLSYAHCIREDPVQAGLLYLGTENGVYVSFDDGENWQPLQMNLPHAPVYWLVVQEHFNDLVHRDLRARHLDPRRHHAAARADAAGAERRRAPVPAAAGVPVPRDYRAGDAV